MKEIYKNIIEVVLKFVIKSIIGITIVAIFALVCKVFKLDAFPFIFFLC